MPWVISAPCIRLFPLRASHFTSAQSSSLSMMEFGNSELRRIRVRLSAFSYSTQQTDPMMFKGSEVSNDMPCPPDIPFRIPVRVWLSTCLCSAGANVISGNRPPSGARRLLFASPQSLFRPDLRFGYQMTPHLLFFLVRWPIQRYCFLV